MSMFNIEHGNKNQHMVRLPGLGASLPVTVVRGQHDGPNVLITAGIHNQEYVGIETANRLANELNPEEINGCVCIIHVCNPTGFFSFTPDIVPEDGENLNRVFPGNEDGTASQRLAHFLLNEFLKEASFFIDLHCGGCREELHPHVYYQGMGDKYLENASRRMAKLVDADYMVRADSYTGSMFSHAAMLGIPGIIVERGGMAKWSDKELKTYIADVKRILKSLNVMQNDIPQIQVPVSIESIDYFNANVDGCWYPATTPGTVVKQGECLGVICDFFGNDLLRLNAKSDCVILYQSGSLAVTSGSFLVACGVL